ncbi:hypothetical protein PDIG_20510 [Penicillium digitatum PHI26]|uniref:Uncharacterized protein n=2 Tax=Penicillium digitatum TaxID=36651 RepID=K9GP74_PEND2|nr:hypothetical protein PDIP_00090 [Penicillium digitatum Pd1]EKV16503.1 hypothetical protein PDIG_20510 [Penicillium digitatum PHI26]EKV22055.1 hypothetical protein PDIP_00090 [Penicillium digitatum Pd1]
MSNNNLSTAMSSSLTVLLPPLFPISDNNRSAWIITVSTVLLILTLLPTTVALISRIRIFAQSFLE